jgi:hypothetical protein
MQKHIGFKYTTLPVLAASLMFAGCDGENEALSGPGEESTAVVSAQVLGHKADLVLYDNSTGTWTVGKSNGSAFVRRRGYRRRQHVPGRRHPPLRRPGVSADDLRDG